MSKKLVAISTKNGKCNCLSICKNVDDREYNELLNEKNKSEQEQQEVIDILQESIRTLNEEILKLKEDIKVLKGED